VKGVVKRHMVKAVLAGQLEEGSNKVKLFIPPAVARILR